jgi:RNA polymerase sigma factor (TIGR02999 family)
MNSAGEVTELLRRWTEGERESMDPLFNLVYPRLRQIAAALFRRESAASLLQPTGVVNELFLKLVSQRTLRFDNREHFFSLAASLMRRILVDHARAARSEKREGGARVALDDDLVWISTTPSVDMLDIHQALVELEQLDPRKVRLVELRFFLGTTSEEAAEILQTSKSTVDRELRFARGWLYDRLQTNDGLAGARLDAR